MTLFHRRRRIWAAVAAISPATLLLSAAPALANTVTPNTPESPNANSISDLYLGVLGVCLTIFVLVGGWLLYTAVRFRERRGDTHEPPQIHGSTRLEIGWTVVPILIVIGLIAFTFWKAPSAEKISSDAMIVKVVAQQYNFNYTYPSGKPAPGGVLILPVNRPVKIQITSKDVIHDWWVPALAPKIDAVPGRINHTGFTPTHVGTYVGQCAEFCGTGHAGMVITVHIVSEQTWDSKYKDLA